VDLTFGFSGDVDGRWRPYDSVNTPAPGQTVPVFDQQNFDYFIFLGDTIYETASAGSPALTLTTSNSATPAQLFSDYRGRYLQQLQPVNPRGVPGLQSFFASTGTYTLYDNHELGNKQDINGGAPPGGPIAGQSSGAGVDPTNPAFDVNTTGTFINQTGSFQALEQAYLDYHPIRETTVNAPGDPRSNGTKQLYYEQPWGANSVFFNLDDRSYRDIRMKTAAGADDTGPRADNPDRTMLGATQLNWFEQSLLAAQNQGTTWKFVAISSPIDQIGVNGDSTGKFINITSGSAFSTGTNDGKSWQGEYRAERNALLKFIADNHITNVVFLSTDDHQLRINELDYSPSGQTAVQSSYVRVPGDVFEIVTGPMGATGPEGVTDHSFANIKSLADSLANKQLSFGIDPIGLDPNYPGLHNVYREGDPTAGTNPQPVDFYSPDTFNWTTLHVSADGQTLTVQTYGINSFAANTLPEPNSAANPVRLIQSFQVTAIPTVALTPDQKFVNAVFSQVLRRNADPTGLAFWSGLLSNGVLRAQVAAGILISPEARGVQVNALSRQYLHRDADTTGQQTFVAFLNTGGTLEQVAALIISSPEYFQNRANGDNNAFLDAVYQDTLGRGVDVAGRLIFSNFLSAGGSRSAAAAAILGSPEYQARLVQGLYETYLGRSADPLGLQLFTSALAGGTRDEAVIAFLLGSAEFGQRV
jgi:3-phytase/alkaline phosphatase D